MSLPSNCKRVSQLQRTISARSPIHQDLEDAYFAIYHESFLDIVGTEPSITLAVEKDYPFAHEAGVFIPEQDAVYVTSNRYQPDGSAEKTIKISKISRQQDGRWQSEEVPTDVAMGNGGINYQADVLFCAQGTKVEPGGLVRMKTSPPYSTETLIDSYHGRLFNSVNDVVSHTDGSIWFTDPIYGFEQGFRNKPQLPCQVYRFDPRTGDVRVVADGFGRPNGLCFSPDEETLYITDTDWIHGDGTIDPMRASTIYAFDVTERHGSHFLASRRVFAMADCGIPDGIKCDLQGNVYSGCNDGVNVWDAGARLIGKIMIPGGGVANFCFMRKGELALLNETRFWVVKISESRQGALLANMDIDV
ncbi:hypothetical protein LTR36_010439 [Oleoguttula mirabilis]|uniref:SMP-30/Gluconolactonase/LRE-like region domain-containing protein n=1 Tax=Oleoguttula mirabilis TaxID=1507867 RepID=A0AAV9J406_9PEZI|nr:hypothetical protein LTR36_010439 [Oleoguttula mirabilis]